MIEVSGLTKTFGRHRAVDDLSFLAEDGRVTGFVGPNGAGKSTTMRCIIGLDTATSGSATINGVDYRDVDAPVSRVGALLDPTWLHPGRTARAHLRWVADTARLPRTRVEEMLELVGLTTVADQRVTQFSLGMRQRLGIAVALLGDPDNLVLDEPLNGLDPEGVRWARGLIRRYADSGRSVLISSHLLSELSLVADSVVLVGKGRLLRQQSVAELVAGVHAGPVVIRVDTPDHLVGLAREHGWDTRPVDGAPDSLELLGDTLTTDDVGRACAAAGIAVLELRTESGTLEDAVIDLTQDHVEYATTKGAA